MSELIKLLQDFDFTQVGVILILGYLAYTEIMKRYKTYKKDHKNELEEYHEQQSQEEKKEEDFEERISTLEDTAKTNEDNIDKLNTSIDEMKNVVNGINNTLLKVQITQLRSAILDFVPESSDHNKFLSMEKYNQIFTYVKEYTELCEIHNIENHVMTYSVEKIHRDYDYRLENNGFWENQNMTPRKDK